MGSWIIHQTDRGAEDERCVLLVTNGYYWLLTVTNGYSGLLGARPGSFKNGRTAGHRGAFFGNHPLTSGEGQSGLGRWAGGYNSPQRVCNRSLYIIGSREMKFRHSLERILFSSL